MQIYLTRRARKDLDRLPSKLGLKLQSEIAKLAINSFPPNYKKLQGEDNIYRIRVGDYRIVYEIEKITQQIVVAKIKHRKDVYR